MKRVLFALLVLLGAASSQCAVPVDNYLVNSSTIFCEGTYNITDTGTPGIIIANAHGVDISCNGTIIVGTGSGAAVNLSNRNSTTIRDCTFSNYSVGIDVQGASGNTITNNSIDHATFPVRIRPISNNSYYNIIENNTFGFSNTSVYLFGVYATNRIGNSTIAYNVIQNCSSYGIHLDQKSNFMGYNRIVGNDISNCTNSLRMWVGDNGNGQLQFTTIENNTFSNGTYGVFLDAQDSRHALNFNNFTNNTFIDFSSGYAAFFNSNLTYNNNFGSDNTFDGFPFYHFAYRSGFSIGNLGLNSSNDATNIGLFTIVNSSDFTLSGSNITGDGEYGVFLWSNNRTLVSGSNISGNGEAIGEANVFVFGENNSNITNNVIGNSYHGVALSLSWKNGLYNNSISNGTNSGVVIYASSNNTIAGNNITNSSFGVRVLPAAYTSVYNVIENNTIGGSGTCIYFNQSYFVNRIGDNRIAYNNIQNCSTYGINFEANSGNDLSFNRIIGNNISNSPRSIRMWSGNNGLAQLRFNIVENNTFSNGTYGVFLDVDDSRHALNFNNFTNNTFFDFSSGYAVFFNDNLTYNNDFGGNNTYDGFPFYHFAYRSGFSIGNLDLNASNDATNLGMFGIVNSSDFTLSGSNITGDGEYGVFLWSNNRTLVSGSNISGNGPNINEANIFAFGENDSNITNNVIGSGYHGIVLSLSWKNGVYNNTITNGTNSGVVIHASSNNTIAGNSITNSSFGVRVLPAAYTSVYNVIENNTIGGGNTSIYFNQSYFVNRIGDNRIAYNNIQNCSSQGINFEANSLGSPMSFNRIIGNNISNCSVSVRFWSGNNGLAALQFNTVENNTFGNGTYGVFLDVDDSRHVLNFNNFTNNTFFGFSSGYAAFFNDNLTYNNDFGGNNTFDGFPFYHFAYRSGGAVSALDLNSSNDATNLGMFSVINSSNFVLSGSNVTGDGEYGVFLWFNNRTSILDSDISGNGPGANEANVFTVGENESNITGNRIGGGYHGIALTLSRGIGVYDNSIGNNSNSGIHIAGSNSTIIAGNRIVNATYGVRVLPANGFLTSPSYYNIIENNTIGGGDTGVHFSGTYFGNRISNSTVAYNSIGNCTGNGVHLEQRSGNTMNYMRVIENNITNCSAGVRMFAGDNGFAFSQFNSIEGNLLGDVQYGLFLHLDDDASRHRINFTNFTGNYINASIYPIFMADAFVSNNTFSGNTLINDNASNFIFSSAGANNTFSNTTFARGMGRINFPQSGILINRSVNVTSVKVGSDIASINSSNLTAYAGLPANVTTYSPSCAPTIYAKSGFPLTSADILANGSLCSSPQCEVVSCSASLATFSVSSFSGYTANASNCMVINSPGAYVQTADFSGAPNGGLPVAGTACVRINSSDVSYDCNGFGMSHNGTTNTFGIFAGGNLTNITIMNCPDITRYYYGIYLYQVNLSTVRNVTMFNNSYDGMHIRESSHNTIIANRFVNNTWYGMYMLLFSGNNSVLSNNASGHRYWGLVITNGANNNTVRWNNAFGNGGDGIMLSASSYNLVADNLANGNGNATFLGNGIYVGGWNNTIRNNTASGNNRDGFWLSGGENNTFEDNLAEENARDGVYLDTANGHTFTGNVVRDNGWSGFALSGSLLNRFDSNEVTGNNASGFNLTWGGEGDPSANNTLSDNNVTGNMDGFSLDIAVNNSIRGNIVSGSLRYGAYISTGEGFFILGNNTLLSGNRYSGNGYDVFVNASSPMRYRMSGELFLSPSGTAENYTNLSINDSASAEEYSISWAANSSALPAGYDSFRRKFVEISQVQGTPSIDSVAFHWTDAELSGYDESDFELWKYNSSGWAVLNITPDTSANALSLSSHNPASVYGILQNSLNSNISLIKLDQTAAQTSPGGLVQFNITVNNTGNSSLNVTVLDALPQGLTFVSASPANASAGPLWSFGLAPGASSVLFLNATVDSGTVNQSTSARNLTNYVNATGTAPNGANVTAEDFEDVTVYYANLSVIKLDQTAAQPSPGGLVQFNITLTNTGNVTLDGTLSDALPSGLTFSAASPANTSSGPSWTFSSLSPGASLVFYLNATADAGLVNASSPTAVLSNCITATGAPPNGANVSSADCQDVTIYYANVSVIKLSQTTAQPSPGGLVQFNITVNNTGNVTLNTSVLDSLPPGLSFGSASPANDTAGPSWTFNLSPGSSAVIYLNATVDAGAVNASVPVRNLTNNVSATGVPPNGNNVTSASSANVTIYYANVSVIKLDQTAAQPSPGGTVQFNITITNTGNVTLNPLSVADALPSGLVYSAASPAPDSTAGGVITWNVGPVSPGSGVTLRLNATMNGSAGCDYNATNSVNVTGSPPNGDNVTATDDVSAYLACANISIIKLGQSTAQPSPGGIVQFNITVNNTGNVSLNATVRDVLPAGLSFSAAFPANSSAGPVWNIVLAPLSGSVIYLNSTVAAGVVNSSVQSSNLTNYINATGIPPNGNQVFAEDFENVTVYYANVSVVKVDSTPSPASPGGLVQWSINVSNPGLVSLDPVAVSDTLPSGFRYSASSPLPDSISADNRTINWSNVGPIASGGSILIQLNSTVGNVSNGTYSNNVSATATPPNGDDVSASDTASVGIFAPAINLVKTVNQSNASIGQNVTFTLNVTNTGSSSLTISIVDALAANTTFQGSDVPPTSVSGQMVSWDNVTVLAPGSSFVIRYNASANSSGTFTNIANASGVPPNGNAVNDSDSAFVTTLTPPPPSEDSGGEDNDPLRISLSSSCSGTTVTVSSRGEMVSGASVRVDGTLAGTTGSNGQLTLQGCGETVEIRASKSGYETEEKTFQLISCLACEEPEQNDTNQTEPEPQFECDTDSDCPIADYCLIPAGAAGGNCEPVIPGLCGEVRNHSFVPYGYECGNETGCPACPGGSICQEHSCMELNLSAPASAFVNDTVTIYASNETGPCVLCDVQITDPSGRILTGRTDAQGNFHLPLAIRGQYSVTLLYDGLPIKTIRINALPREEPAEPEKPPVTTPQEEFPWWLLIVLLLVILGIIYWRTRKKR